ncbi:MAG: hypothetical protein NT022_02435 [Deltaproteobacteria bacterium]|nr:hypothetical protein [Deltaproteobacteria bacterium]
MTNFGFFSIVQKKDDDILTVRARARGDLETLQERYVPTLGHILKGEGTDYQYRARVSRAEMAEALGKIIMDIDYSNFKDSVAEKQGRKRARLYEEVWGALLNLQK